MPIVSVRHLGTDHRQVKRVDGRFGAVRSLFRRETITRTAVSDSSFGIEPGEAVGYIGPNSAGTSTTIKMLTGILVPTRGEAEVLGMTPHRHRRHNARRIGGVFGQRMRCLPIPRRRCRHARERWQVLCLCPFASWLWRSRTE